MRPTHAREGNLLYSVYHLNVSLIQKHPHRHIESNVWPNAWPPRGPVKLTRWINHHTVWVQKILCSFYYSSLYFFQQSLAFDLWASLSTYRHTEQKTMTLKVRSMHRQHCVTRSWSEGHDNSWAPPQTHRIRIPGREAGGEPRICVFRSSPRGVSIGPSLMKLWREEHILRFCKYVYIYKNLKLATIIITETFIMYYCSKYF